MSQLPTSANPPTSNRIQSVCSSFTPVNSGGGVGPGCSGVFEGIPTGQIVNIAPGRYPRYVNGQHVGDVTEVVIFDKKPIVAEIACYLLPMYKAAAAAGHPIKVTSGYRTPEDQLRIQGKAGKLAAASGKSPHQNGIGVDINSYGTGYDWLIENAYRYGFVRRVRNERWHWEYLGTWPGQEIPEWAQMWRKIAPGRPPWGSTMFQFVKRDGSNASVLNRMRYSKSTVGANHPDWTGVNEAKWGLPAGSINTWVNDRGIHVPTWLDQNKPGWDQLGDAQLPTSETLQPDEVENGTNPPVADTEE